MASYCLTLLGKVLHLTPLLSAGKFKNKGKKDGAIAAFKELEDNGIGTIEKNNVARGCTIVNVKLVV